MIQIGICRTNIPLPGDEASGYDTAWALDPRRQTSP